MSLLLFIKDFKGESEFIDYYEKKALLNFNNTIHINNDINTFIEFSTGVAVYSKNGLRVDG